MSALKQTLSKKTDSQLKYYIDHVDKHTDDAVLIALAELKSRNVALPADIDNQIRERLKRRDSMGNARQWDHFNKDVEVVVIYPQWSIYFFSVFLFTLVGAAMLSYNLNKLGKPSKGPIYFGLGFSILLFAVHQIAPIAFGYSFIFNILGAALLYVLFPKPPTEQKIVKAKSVVGMVIFTVLVNIWLVFMLLLSLNVEAIK